MIEQEITTKKQQKGYQKCPKSPRLFVQQTGSSGKPQKQQPLSLFCWKVSIGASKIAKRLKISLTKNINKRKERKNEFRFSAWYSHLLLA